MIWYVIGAVVAFDVAFVMGCAWRSQHSVSRDTFDEAMKQNARAVEMIWAGRLREHQLRGMLEASNRLLEQATKPRDPNAIDWSKIGV